MWMRLTVQLVIRLELDAQHRIEHSSVRKDLRPKGYLRQILPRSLQLRGDVFELVLIRLRIVALTP